MVFIFVLVRRRALLALAVILGTVFAAWALVARVAPALGPAPQRREVPIIMYHSLLYDRRAAGPYVLSPEDLTADMVWLREHGYSPVSVGDLQAFVAGMADLPQKPVVITFDDGHLNNLTYLPALLEELDFCATISVVGEFSENYTARPDPNPAYAYLTWEDIATLAQNPRVEIGNHSYFTHSRIPVDAKKRVNYRETLVRDAADMQQALLSRSGVDARVYAYPYGFVIKGADDQLRAMGFQATLSCAEHVNTITEGDGDCLFSLGRFNRPSGESSEAFMARILNLN